MKSTDKLRIAVLHGDGIGPEITTAAVNVLEAAADRVGLGLQLTNGLVGWKAYEKHKSTVPQETLDLLGAHEGWIVGPTFAGEYPQDDPIRGHPSGFIRRHFKLFANTRPVEAWPQFNPLVPDLRVTVMRENTEGFYPDRNLAWGYGEFMPTDDVAVSLRVITRVASEQIARYAFDYARANGHDHMVIIHKRTSLKKTDGMFCGAFERLEAEYPEVRLEQMRIDTFSSAFPRNPHYFKLVVTTNLFGDILSDQAAGLAGGVGMASALNAGFDYGMAQAAHGTAPDIAGKGISNPSALILSVALLMNWFYQRTQNEACQTVARLIDDGVRLAVERGTMTPDLGGTATTASFGDAIISTFDEALETA